MGGIESSVSISLLDFQLTTSMEEVISRFPHIAEICFEELDNYNLIQCKVISQSWKNFIEENKCSSSQIKETKGKYSF